MKINYKNRKIDLTKCEKFDDNGDYYTFQIDEMTGKNTRQTTFVELTKWEYPDDFDKVKAYIIDNDIDDKLKKDDSEKIAYEKNKEEIAMTAHLKKEKDLEDRLKALEDLIGANK